MDFLARFDAAIGWPVGTAAVLVMAVCGVCAVIARFLCAPKEGDGLAYRLIYGVVNRLAQNAGHAANADDAARANNAAATDGTRAAAQKDKA